MSAARLGRILDVFLVEQPTLRREQQRAALLPRICLHPRGDKLLRRFDTFEA